MFLSRESDYAVRIIRCLCSGERKSTGAICSEEVIPKQFAYKILKKLEHAQIVKSIRGPHGGYQLECSLSTLSLYDIVAAIEGPIYLNECMEQHYICPRNSDAHPCKVHQELCEIQNTLVKALQAKSMADIL